MCIFRESCSRCGLVGHCFSSGPSSMDDCSYIRVNISSIFLFFLEIQGDSTAKGRDGRIFLLLVKVNKTQKGQRL